MRFACLIALLFIEVAPQAYAGSNCEEQLQPSEIVTAMSERCSAGCDDRELAQAVETAIETKLRKTPAWVQRARGYSVVITTMVASAAASSYLTSSLPEHWKFLSQVVGQVATLGVFVFGAPIWEPLSSGFRKFAFGVSDEIPKPAATDQRLEAIWKETQRNYSLNAQMSRNVVHTFLVGAQQNFQSAYLAATAGNDAYAADQLSLTAARMRALFADLPPGDPIVADTVRATFARHVQVTPEFVARVGEGIQRLDPLYDRPEVRAYYAELLAAWFTEP